MCGTGIGGTASRLSIETEAARTFKSTFELARGVKVGVTGLGPYDTISGFELARAASSSSRPELLSLSMPQNAPLFDEVGECGAVGEYACMLELSERTSSYPVDPGNPSKTGWGYNGSSEFPDVTEAVWFRPRPNFSGPLLPFERSGSTMAPASSGF